MTDIPMTSYVSELVRGYDSIAFDRVTDDYLGHSNFLNFGYWDEHTRDQREACENLMEKLLSFIPDKSGTILDVACGKGGTTRYLLRYYTPRNVTAINISERQLRSAKANAPGCSFYVMGATELGFSDGSFDNVLCVEAAFHFDTREKFLREAYRVLKEGGRIVLSDILMNLEAEKRRRYRTERNYIECPEGYKEVLRGVGFKDVEVIDATEQCWRGYFRHVVRYFHEKFLAREIGYDCLRKALDRTYGIVPDLEYYLLAVGCKG